MTSDPFDEFEFKPITEGLGFHKKAVEKNSMPLNIEEKPQATQDKPLFKETLNSSFNLIEENPSSEILTPPLPRKNKTSVKGTDIQVDSSAVDEILRTLKQTRNADFATRADLNTPQVDKYIQTQLSIAAGILDSMLIIASTLLFMIALLMVTKVDLIATLTNSQSNPMVYIATLAMFATVVFVYYVTNRIFIGATPGEWAYEMTVGEPQKIGTSQLMINQVKRTLFVIFTGFIISPIISMILRQDIAGKISGAYLVKKV